MRCEDVNEKRLSILDDLRSGNLDVELEAHLASCPCCREKLAEFEATWDLLDLYPEETTPHDFVARTMRAVQVERARERSRARWRWGSIAAAALVLIGLALLFQADLDGGGGTRTPTGAGAVAESELIENLELIEDMEFLEQYSADLDLAMEYEFYLTLGGEESL